MYPYIKHIICEEETKMNTIKNPIIKYGSIALLLLMAACSPKSDVPPDIVQAIEAATPAGQQLSPAELEQVVQAKVPEFKIRDYLEEGSLPDPYEMKADDTLWKLWNQGDKFAAALRVAYKNNFDIFMRVTCLESDMDYTTHEGCDNDLRKLQPGQSIKVYLPEEYIYSRMKNKN
jgi:hypothetical protein